MPVPPPTPSVPFDLVDDAMDAARVRLNDCPLALSGNLLADTQPYAQQIYNDAWREFQRDLSQYGDPAQTSEFVTYSLPVVANLDPSVQVYLGQAAYFDGTSYWDPPTVNLIPQDCICPLHIKERLGGTIQLFSPMVPCDNGLPGGPKTTYLRYWEWRSAGPGNGNAIFMPGATVPRDLWIRYAAFLPDAQDNLPLQLTPWYGQPIPILRVSDILAYYIAAEFAFSRGSDQARAVANSFWASGKEQMRNYVNSTTMKLRQRINHRRRPYSGYRHQGWAWW
jgi:hypothetical protein